MPDMTTRERKAQQQAAAIIKQLDVKNHQDWISYGNREVHTDTPLYRVYRHITRTGIHSLKLVFVGGQVVVWRVSKRVGQIISDSYYPLCTVSDVA